jgi:RNA polymerase sigma-70 factor (ECF subfamily)
MTRIPRSRMDDPLRATESARARLALVTSIDATTLAAAEPLLPRIASGDEHAVRECVSRYGALVWSLVRRWSPNAQDAEDAVQDVFIDLWRSASRFDAARATEAGWVAMVTRRRLIDRMRRRQRLPELEPLPADLDVADERSQDVAHELDQSTRVERARTVLRDLPAAQRRMLELSLLEGKTHDEIARETDTPLGTVKSHIRRGLKRARDLMQGGAVGAEGEE